MKDIKEYKEQTNFKLAVSFVMFVRNLFRIVVESQLYFFCS